MKVCIKVFAVFKIWLVNFYHYVGSANLFLCALSAILNLLYVNFEVVIFSRKIYNLMVILLCEESISYVSDFLFKFHEGILCQAFKMSLFHEIRIKWNNQIYFYLLGAEEFIYSCWYSAI